MGSQLARLGCAHLSTRANNRRGHVFQCVFFLDVHAPTDVAIVGCILMYITAAAPNRRCLGALNGVAQTTASVVRAIGPASATSLFAYSIQHNFMGGYGVYIVLVFGTVATMPLSAMLPDDVAESC